jgi:hypothetical protein
MALLLLVSAAASLFCSRNKLLWFDEILVKWTDSVPTARQVADIQIHYPVSLDPIGYHEIEHAAVRLFGSNAFGLRLPSVLGFLAMQMCLFFFARRIAGTVAGLIALAFPVFTGAFYYSSEARPYGLILGFSAVAIVSWQSAVMLDRRRVVSLFTLAIALILVINVHYYGFLVTIPLFAAELSRTIMNRRIDRSVWAALLAGSCGIIFVLPSLPAAREFLPHLWDRKGASFAHVWRTYFIAMPHFAVDHDSPKWMMVLVMAGFVFLLGICFLKVRIWLRSEMLPISVLLATLMALPVLGFVSALVTHALEPRYLIITVLGFSCFAALSLAWWLPDRGGYGLPAILAVLVALTGFAHGVRNRTHSDEIRASFAVSPAIKSALLASPARHLYMANGFLFAQMAEYETDPDVRSRLTFVYSEPEEVQFGHMDTFSLTALHMVHFSALNTRAYESLATTPGPYLYLLKPIPDPPPGSFGSDWITSPATLAGATIRPVGKLADGEVLDLSFPKETTQRLQVR